MPPKGSAAKGAPKREEKVVSPAPAATAAPLSVPIAANSGKASNTVSYLSMLRKSAPAVEQGESAAATVAAAPTDLPKPKPELVDLPISAGRPVKGAKKGDKKNVQAQQSNSAAAEAIIAVPAEEATHVASVVEESAPVVDEVAAPEVVVEAATPVIVVPASPEKLAADEAPEVAIAPSHIEESAKEESSTGRMNWADVEPGYSTFSNHHLFSGVAQESADPVAPQVDASSSKLVSFRGPYTVSHRLKFLAPSNDKVVSSLLQLLRVREDEVVQREENLRVRENDVRRREESLNQERNKLTNDRQAVEREREILRQQQQQQAQQATQQQQLHSSHQQVPPHQSSGYHHRHSHHHHHHHHMAQQHEQAPWDEEQFGGYDAYMYQAQPRYGRPVPRPQQNNFGRASQQVSNYQYPQPQVPAQQRMPRSAPMQQHQMGGYSEYPQPHTQQQNW